MHPDPTHATVKAWCALLTLSEVERTHFLAAARNFDAATTMRSVLPVPAPAPTQVSPTMVVARPPTEMLAVTGDTRTPARRRGSGAHAAKKLLTLSASETKVPAHTTSLPLVGGAALDLAPRTAFTEASFIDRWRPGTIIGVYCGGNQRLACLVRPLRLHAYAVGSDPGVGKIGTARDIAQRMTELGHRVHAGVSKADPTSIDTGFRSWSVEPLPVATTTPSPGSPVRVVGDGLECRLPVTLTANAFDKRLAKALASASLAGWASGAEGQAICAAHDVDPRTLVRGTPGPGGRVAWSTELVLIRPRHDAVRLMRLCEQIIITHVMTEPSSSAVVEVATATRRARINNDAVSVTRLPTASSRSGRPRTR